MVERESVVDRKTKYDGLKQLAREKRNHHQVETAGFGLQKMRSIYRDEGITIDLWPYPTKKLRAAYVIHAGRPHVLLKKSMPDEPRLFSMGHELKHHYADREAMTGSLLGCKEFISFSEGSDIEIGAEIFAAEFIFPEDEFVAWATRFVAPGRCTKRDVVILKRNCPAKVSYTFIVKRLEWLGFIEVGQFARERWVKLEEELFGPPLYKRLLARRQFRGAVPPR